MNAPMRPPATASAPRRAVAAVRVPRGAAVAPRRAAKRCRCRSPVAASRRHGPRAPTHRHGAATANASSRRVSTTAAAAASASGTWKRKIARQSNACVSAPPSAGTDRGAEQRRGHPEPAAAQEREAGDERGGGPGRLQRAEDEHGTECVGRRRQRAGQRKEREARRPQQRGRTRAGAAMRPPAAGRQARPYRSPITAATPSTVVSRSTSIGGSASVTIDASASARPTPAAISTRTTRIVTGILPTRRRYPKRAVRRRRVRSPARRTPICRSATRIRRPDACARHHATGHSAQLGSTNRNGSPARHASSSACRAPRRRTRSRMPSGGRPPSAVSDAGTSTRLTGSTG